MKKIFLFSIPAHGHTNPMLPVAAKLVDRGNKVYFFSFKEFEEKINNTGSEFIECDSFLPKLNENELAGLKSVSTTEMTIQDIRTTLNMDKFLEEKFKAIKPDVVYTDSVCFWGKLNALKHNIPMVVSTSTFAFNQMSSQYMKYSPKELADMIFGLPKISKELKKLRPYGYNVKNALSLVQSDNKTDSIVYTSRRFQPFAESYSDHYLFVGPSVFSDKTPDKEKERPLVYIALGTVINERPDFYKKCIDALKNEDVDVIISCGLTTDIKLLGELPAKIKVFPRVDQPDVLSKADVFITHCGMNSVSESLYMATPMLLYPQTSEQFAVARRAREIGAGIIMEDDSVEGIASSVKKILENDSYSKAAKACCDDFRACPGSEGAAEFIENAPHKSNGIDLIVEVNKKTGLFQIIFWAIIVSVMLIVGFSAGWIYIWMIGIPAGVLSYPIAKFAQKLIYNKIKTKYQKKY